MDLSVYRSARIIISHVCNPHDFVNHDNHRRTYWGGAVWSIAPQILNWGQGPSNVKSTCTLSLRYFISIKY